MKVKNWVAFIVLTILVFAVTLVATYSGEIMEAIKSFPVDRVVSFIAGAVIMFIASSNWSHNQTPKKKSDEEAKETIAKSNVSAKPKDFKEYDVGL